MNPPRTNPGLVQGVLVDDYDGVTSLTPFIRTASAVIDRVVAMAARKGSPGGGPTTEERVLLETWMAAHFYCATDKPYSSRSTEGASGSFQVGSPEKGFASTEYGRAAIAMDYSGCLENLGKKQRATMAWLGKPPSSQVPVDQRD